jgi:diketogulonate reductase-like aldo/keto reductase
MATEPTTQTQIPTVSLPGGERIPVLGIGTWNIGEKRSRRADEVAALQTAIDLGMTVIDTAEMYGGGAAETLVAEAVGARRSEIFLVSKVMPQNASRRGTISSCEASLRRLKTDRLDMYLLHWRGSVPLDETLEAFNRLRRDGKIRHWGVSNFDVDDMDEVAALTMGAGTPVATNQVLYNVTRRGIEYDLLPWCRTHGIPLMAYSPLEQGLLAKHKTLQAIGKRLTATPAQVALAWVLRQPGVVAIPKAGRFEHVRENRGALEIDFAPEDLAELDETFAPPTHKAPLDMT